jgi:diguanylate cyclase (GGDEF)-like protein
MLQPERILLLDLPQLGPPRPLLPSRSEDLELPESLLDKARGLDAHEFVQETAADIVYIMAQLEAGHTLLVGKTEWNETSERLLVGMVRVYQNFMKLMRDSEKDTLTGLSNRRKLETYLASRLGAGMNQAEGEVSERGDYLAVLDLDKFKRINDTYGHLIGDEVLLTFANILRASLRDGDRSFRYGGEEFIVVLSEVTAEQAETILDRLRGNVEAHDFPQVGRVTVSVGYTRIAAQELPTRIIEEADKALYYAKEHGRNQVRDYRALLAAGEIEDSPHDGGIELF